MPDMAEQSPETDQHIFFRAALLYVIASKKQGSQKQIAAKAEIKDGTPRKNRSRQGRAFPGESRVLLIRWSRVRFPHDPPKNQGVAMKIAAPFSLPWDTCGHLPPREVPRVPCPDGHEQREAGDGL